MLIYRIGDKMTFIEYFILFLSIPVFFLFGEFLIWMMRRHNRLEIIEDEKNRRLKKDLRCNKYVLK